MAAEQAEQDVILEMSPIIQEGLKKVQKDRTAELIKRNKELEKQNEELKQQIKVNQVEQGKNTLEQKVDLPFQKIREKINAIKTINKEQQTLQERLISYLNEFEKRLKKEILQKQESFYEELPFALEKAIGYVCDEKTTVKEKLRVIEQFRNEARGLGPYPQRRVKNIIAAEISCFILFGGVFSIVFPFAFTQFVFEPLIVRNAAFIKVLQPLSAVEKIALAIQTDPHTFATVFSTAALVLVLLLLIMIAATCILTMRNDYELLVDEKDHDRGQELSKHLKKMVEGDAPENKNVSQISRAITSSESTSAKGSFFPAAPEPPEPTICDMVLDRLSKPFY